MLKTLAKVGKTAYRAAATTGLAAGTEQPPYPCALPLQVLSDPNDAARAQEMLDAIFAAAKDLLENDAAHKWQLVDYQDPDKGGDLHLFTRPHIGPFNFAKATMSFKGKTPHYVMDTIHCDDLEGRKKYSANIAVMEIIARPTPTATIQYQEYSAPPPLASREFVYLSEKKYVKKENAHYVYGCTIDYTPRSKKGSGHIRASCLFAWRFTQNESDTMATYVSCMNPRGWTPTFLVGWLKKEIGKELVACRRVVYGETIKHRRAKSDLDSPGPAVDGSSEEEEEEEERERSVKGKKISKRKGKA